MAGFKLACEAFNVMKCTQIKCLNFWLFKSRYCNIFGHSRLWTVYFFIFFLYCLFPLRNLTTEIQQQCRIFIREDKHLKGFKIPGSQEEKAIGFKTKSADTLLLFSVTDKRDIFCFQEVSIAEHENSNAFHLNCTAEETFAKIHKFSFTT